jgi:hypothetical protein
MLYEGRQNFNIIRERGTISNDTKHLFFFFDINDPVLVLQQLYVAIVLVRCSSAYFASFAFKTLKKLPPRILVISFLLYPFSTNAFVING